MDDMRSIYIDGLRNAYALEGQALSMIERQLERIESYPEARAMLERHKTETEQQRRRLETILERNGTSPSTFKDLAQSLMGNIAAIGHAMAGDEILKNTFANYAFEHFEIAAYRSLIVMAKQVDQAAVAELEKTLREEEGMARSVGEGIEAITLHYVSREEAGQRAAS